MAGRPNQLKEKPRCGLPLKDGSACLGIASAKVWGGRCEYHGLKAVGAEHGWRVRGNRRAGVYVADQDGRFLVADTPLELVGLLDQAQA